MGRKKFNMDPKKVNKHWGEMHEASIEIFLSFLNHRDYLICFDKEDDLHYIKGTSILHF